MYVHITMDQTKTEHINGSHILTKIYQAKTKNFFNVCSSVLACSGISTNCKIDFQDNVHCGHLGFQIEKF